MKPETSTLPTSNDFGDWLNPMLVKELRQGLKTNVFVGVFVLVQAAMILLVGFRLLSMGTADASDAGEWLDGVLWFALGAALLLIMPLRGLHTISEETKQNTLDLVQLTHLGAMRIVTGKWIAIVGQVLLLTMAVLPYAVLRYFFGGVDVVSNLTSLMGMLLASTVISAACVMLSTVPAVTRSLLIGLLFFMFFSSGFGFLIRTSIGGTGFGAAPFSVIAALFSAGVAIAFLLALAASRIAAAAENFAFVLRSIALGTALISLIAVWAGSRSSFWVITPWLMGGWSIFEAMTERTNELPSLYAPWVRRGRLGRIPGKIFYPGWATGLIYTGIMVAALIAITYATLATSDRKELLMMAPFCYLAAVFPVPLLLLRGIKNRGWIYALVQLAGLILFAFGRMIASFVGDDDIRVAVVESLTPISTVLSMTTGWLGDMSDAHWKVTPIIGLGIAAASLIWLLVCSVKEFRLIRQMEARAVQPASDTAAS